MTGEHDERDDELEFEASGESEDAFILEDWDELDDVLAEVESEVGRQSDLGGADGGDAEHVFVVEDEFESLDVSSDDLSPDDVLFGSPSSRAPRDVPFEEGGANPWEGGEMDPADIGIPVEQAAATPRPRGGLEGFEDAVDLDDPESGEAGDFLGLGVSEAGDSHLGAEEEPWEPAHAGAEHEPAAGELPEGDWEHGPEGEEAYEDYDPIYGASEEEEAEAAVEAAAGAPASYHEYDESYVDGDWAAADVVPRRSRLPLVASAAAVLITGLAVGTMILKPEWLGMRTAPVLVDRTEIARPALDLLLQPPTAELPPPETGAVDPVPDPDPVTDPEPDPQVGPGPDPVGQVDPVPPLGGGDPDPQVAVGGDPEVAPTPPDPLDPGPDGLVVIEGGDPVDPAAPTGVELVPVGEELRVGERVEGVESARTAHPLAAGLVAGDQAFAQLHNGNFFLGHVKVFSGEDITLRVERGEVTLRFERLRALGMVNSEEYMTLMRTRPGFVKLTNDNRLVGSIVQTEDGKVALQVDASRIVIPAHEIEEISNAVPTGVRVEEGSDDAWIEQMIEKRLRKKGAPAVPEQEKSDEAEPPR